LTVSVVQLHVATTEQAKMFHN